MKTLSNTKFSSLLKINNIYTNFCLNYFCIFKLIILLSIIKFIKLGTLILDSHNPITIYPPIRNLLNTKIDIKFALPKDTNGLINKQYIGIVFPINLSTELKFSENTTPKYTCKLNYIEPLSDSVNDLLPNKDINIQASVPELSKTFSSIPSTSTNNQDNIAYCKIEDTLYTPFKAFSKFNLSLELINAKFESTYFVSGIGLFTSTTNTSERIILDSHPIIGSLAVYPNYLSSNTLDVPLEIISSEVTPTSGPNSGLINGALYAYNSFDVTLTIKSNRNFSSNDNVFTFQYPKDMIRPPSSIYSQNYGTNTNELKLSTNILIDKDSFGFNKDSILINNLDEYFYPGRIFKILLVSWVALDTNMNNTDNLNLILYYKNTYTAYSYSSKPIFKVNYSELTAKIDHPEYWDIYSNAAWPLKFVINSNNDLSKGGYLLIQHTNMIDNDTRWNFVASTCDFSENSSSYENAFGRRPNCFPLRNDFLYDSLLNNNPNNGSGIIVKINPLYSKDNLIVTVWGYADVCGTTFDPTITPNDSSYRQFKFKLTLYKYFDITKMNEERLIINNSNQIIATSLDIQMGNKCWNTYVSGVTNYSTIGERYGNTISGTIGTDKLLMKEITDFTTLDALDLNCTSCLIYDSWTNALSRTSYSQNTNERFLYSSSNQLTNGSFFLLVANIPKINEADKLSLYLPGPFTTTNAYPNNYIPGRIQFQFSRKWVSPGNDYRQNMPTDCYVSWSVINDWTTKTNNGEVSLIVTDSSSGAGGNKNFIHTKSMLDTTNTQLPPQVQFNIDKSTIYKIVSEFEPANGPGGGSVGTRSILQFFIDPVGVNPTIAPSTPFGQLSLFTTCLRWNTSTPQVTSIYEYLDTQIHWIGTQFNSSLSPVTKVIRFIKLYLEGGVFQEYKVHNFTGSSKLMYNHHAFFENTLKNNVCIIEINGQALKDSADTYNNTILIFLKNAFLLETDYTDNSIEYPVLPIVTNIKAYSNNSSYNISYDNHYSKGINLTNSSTPNTYFDYLRDIYNSTPFLPYRSSYHNYLSSVIYMNGITSNSVTTLDATIIPNLLIPYYCPIVTDPIINKIVLNDPIVTIQWATLKSYSSIERTSNIISENGSIKAGSLNIAKQISIQDRKTTTINNQNATFYPGTVRFAQYSSNLLDSEKMLYLYNGTNKDASTGNVNCSSNIVFLHPDIKFSEDKNIVIYPNVSSNTFTTQNLKRITILGKIFDKTILTTTGSSNSAPLTYSFTSSNLASDISLPSTSNFYYKGILRPDVSLFSNSNENNSAKLPNLSTLDYIAFYCISNADENTILSNYIIDSGVNNFILDYNPDLSSSFNNIILTTEKNENLILNDEAGNFKTSFSLPAYVPSGSLIILSSSNGLFSSDDAQCAIENEINILKTSNVNTQNLDSIRNVNNLILADQCYKKTTNEISCPILSKRKQINICCQNIKVSDPIYLDSVYSFFPSDKNVLGISSYIKDLVYYSLNSQNDFEYNGFTNNSQLLSDIIPKLNNLNYSFVNQNNGLGYATFNIDIGRSVSSNMIFEIHTNLKKFLISSDFKPLCKIGFNNSKTIGFSNGSILYSLNNKRIWSSNFNTNIKNDFNSWEDGSSYIGDCRVDLNNTIIPIAFTTKNYIYKCGIKTSNKLNITLYPVYLVDYSLIENDLDKSLIIKGFNKYSSSPIVNNSNLSIINNIITVEKSPSEGLFRVTDLFEVNIEFPIPDETNVYYFKFMLETLDVTSKLNNKDLINNKNNNTPNEISLFFPSEYYGELFIDNILCLNGNNIVNCYFIDKNVLIIYDPSISIISNIEIKILNMFNPVIQSYKDIIFSASINSFNILLNERINLVNGSGRLLTINSGINTTKIQSFNKGILKFSNFVDNPVSDTNPRNISNHTFRLSIDTTHNISKLPITIDSNPILVITFPKEYKLTINSLVENNYSKFQGISNVYNLSNKAVSASNTIGNKSNMKVELYEIIDENITLAKESTGKLTTSKNPINVEFIQISNNLIIKLIDSSYTFKEDLVYWEINTINVINIDDNSDNSSNSNMFNNNKYNSVSPFKAMLTNSNLSCLYRIYSNTNSMANEIYDSRIMYNSYLKYNKGFTFKFDNKKWIIDIITSPQLNRGEVKPGRYTKFFFKNKQNNSKLMYPASTRISINNKTFKLNESYIEVPSSLFGEVEFYIGCNCKTAPGKYLIYFKSDTSNIDNTNKSLVYLYSSVIQFTAEVIQSKGLVYFETNSTVVRSGSLYVYYYLSDRTYEELNIKFIINESVDLINDLNEQKTSEIIPTTIKSFDNTGKTIFKTYSSNQTGKIIFIADKVSLYQTSNCFAFDKDILEISVDAIAANIPNNAITVNDFSYYNFDSNPTLEKDSIKFMLQSVYKPIYIHCALTCFNMEYPSNEEIKLQVNNINNKQLSYNNSTLIYQTSYYHQSEINPHTIIFNNLLRGQRYKLKCLIESVQADNTLRSKSQIEITYLNSSEGKQDYFIAVNPSLTQCASINFSSNPGNSTKTLLLYYCQWLYSNPKYYNNGCVICSDLYGNKAPGLKFPLVSSCTGTSNFKFKNLPEKYYSNELVKNSTLPDKYTVCPVAGLNCKTDVTGTSDFDKLFNKFIDDINTPGKLQVLLNISGVPVTHIDTYNDNEPPSLQANLGTKDTIALKNGTIKFTLTYPTPLQCYYLINKSQKDNPVNYLEVQSCINPNRCGFTYVDSFGVDNEIVPIENNYFPYDILGNSSYANTTEWNKISYDPGTYNIWTVCYNDIPFPQKPSEVFSAYNFLIEENVTDPCYPNCTDSVLETSKIYLFLNINLIIILAIILIN